MKISQSCLQTILCTLKSKELLSELTTDWVSDYWVLRESIFTLLRFKFYTELENFSSDLVTVRVSWLCVSGRIWLTFGYRKSWDWVFGERWLKAGYKTKLCQNMFHPIFKTKMGGKRVSFGEARRDGWVKERCKTLPRYRRPPVMSRHLFALSLFHCVCVLPSYLILTYLLTYLPECTLLQCLHILPGKPSFNKAGEFCEFTEILQSNRPTFL